MLLDEQDSGQLDSSQSILSIIYSRIAVMMDNGKEKGIHLFLLGLYRDHGKEDGIYYSALGLLEHNGKWGLL